MRVPGRQWPRQPNRGQVRRISRSNAPRSVPRAGPSESMRIKAWDGVMAG